MSLPAWTRVDALCAPVIGLIVGMLGVPSPLVSSLHAQQGELPCIAITDAALPPTTAPFGARCHKAVAESALISQGAGDTTSVTFVNRRKEAVQVYWINHSGRRVFYHQLAPGESYNQPTYLTHPWIVTSATGDPLAAFLPARVERIAVIR